MRRIQQKYNIIMIKSKINLTRYALVDKMKHIRCKGCSADENPFLIWKNRHKCRYTR
ncbi:MAG: hypothetical protein JG770_1810 [Mahella sp.]|nr:hypothetical protein [Mahella sp.]MDK2903785.1 hypothetical protein [Clostridiales bacterium]